MSHKALVSLDINNSWTFKIADIVPKQFSFNIKVDEPKAVPKVKIFSINGQVLCSILEKVCIYNLCIIF